MFTKTSQNKNQNKKYNKFLGFEISENNLVALEIQVIKNNINITNGFRLNIPIFQDLNKTVTLINQNLKAYNIKTKDCAFGLGMQYFKLFPVPLPTSIPKDEIDSIILQEGNLNVNNDSLAWIPLNNTQRQDPDGITRFDVLGIALPKTLVDIAKVVSQKCGLKLISLTPSFLGLGSFLDTKPANLLATLWISQLRSEFVVWSAREPIYEHLFLTHQINEQIFQSVNYIQGQLGGTQIPTIYSSGPFVKETNLSQIPLNIQPFTIPQNISDLGKVLQRTNSTEIIIPLGISLSASNNISYQFPNLLIQAKPKTETFQFQNIFKDATDKKQTNKIGFKVPFAFVIKSLDPHIAKFVYASVATILLSLFLNFFIQDLLTPGVIAKQSVFENKAQFTQAHLTKLLNFEKTFKVLNVKSEYLSELIDKRKPWSKILKEIASMTPKGLWIDRLEIKNNNIDVFGRALDVDSVANFSINLNYTAKLLSKAQIIALRKFEEEGIDIIEFQVSTKVNNTLKT